MEKYEYKLLHYGEKYYVFDYIYLLFFEISETLYKELSCGFGQSDEYVHFLSFLDKYGLCHDSVEHFVEVDNVQCDVASISFPSMHGCNLHCRYCFADAGQNYDTETRTMSSAMLCKIMDRAYKTYFKSYETIKIDFVSGGEPLLHFDTVKQVVEKAIELEEETGKQTEIFLCTNATLLSDEIVTYVDEKDIKLGISLDGVKTENDANRIFSNGEGSYDHIVYWIKRIKGNLRLTAKTRDIPILSVVTGSTQSLVENLKLFHTLGIRTVQFKLCRSHKDADFAISSHNRQRVIEMYEELTNFLITQIHEGNYEYLSMILNDNDYFGKIIRRIVLQEGSTRRCEIGRNKLSFTATGEIFPCDPFMGVSDFSLGHIEDRTLDKEMWESLSFAKSKRCTGCWMRYICSGDCYHNNYLVHQNVYEPDYDYCAINHALGEMALTLICHMATCGDGLIRIKKRLQKKEKLFV